MQLGNGNTSGAKKFRNGATVTIGATYFFAVEPILWDIFCQDNQVFAVTHDLLGAVSFNALGKSGSTWQESYLRYFLNDGLLNEAEINDYAAERTYCSSNNTNDEAGDLLTDKIWTPSYLEIQKFYTTNANRAKKMTEYGLVSGPNDVNNNNGSTHYFLRTISAANKVGKVENSGRAYTDGSAQVIESYLPAFVLNEAAVAKIYGKPDVLPDVKYDSQDHADLFAADNLVDAFSYQYYRDGKSVDKVKDAGEYTVTATLGGYENTTKLTILPQEVTVDYTKLEPKQAEQPYDQTRNVPLNIETAVFGDSSVAGFIKDDNIKIKYSAIMADKNVGEKPVTVTATLSGDDAKNYTLVNPQYTDLTVTVVPRTITITNIKAKDKVYDGNKQAILDTSDLTYTPQIYTGDDLTIWLYVEFDEATVGEHTLTIKSDATRLDGKDKDNYKIGDIKDDTMNLTAHITARAITVTIKDQIVKEGDKAALTYSITSGSIPGVDKDKVDEIFTLGLLNGAELDGLPVGEYTIVGTDLLNPNYDVTFVNGTYRVLSEADWDALQTKEEPKDNNFWLIIIIVIAVAAFIGALVGIGLVIRSHDKDRDNKPKKEKKNKDKNKPEPQTTVADTKTAKQ